jgi:hypothetical protein
MTWDPKDPNETERFAIDWLPRLAAGEVVTGVWTDTPSPLFDLVTTAGLVKGAETFDDRYSYVTLSGGTDGGTAVITARVRTSDGNEIEETRELFIRSTASAVALGDYEVPGAAYFVERYPRFANASGAAVQDALDEAAEQVDETWLARDFPRAVMLYAAHLLTQRCGVEAAWRRAFRIPVDPQRRAFARSRDTGSDRPHQVHKLRSAVRRVAQEEFRRSARP